MTTKQPMPAPGPILPKKAGPIARVYLQQSYDDICEHIRDLKDFRERIVAWAIWSQNHHQPYDTIRYYVNKGEKIGDKLLVLEARLAGIRRLLDEDDIDAGWDT